MKNLIVITLLVMGFLTACKPSEKNYRAAYEAAKAKEAVTPMEETIYANIRKEARHGSAVVDGDTIPMTTEYVSFTTQAGGNVLDFHKYNIVVAQFKQLFNAKAMMSRTVEAGYASAFVVQTREPLYYVVACSVKTPSEARMALDSIRSENRIPMKEPAPWILRTSR
ncbi:MAG: SPOR domain-containing protein [Muribaculaceae bacterium]|nr:SPOR domain-containing protein [Muribaculaceae bacterium]